MHDIRAPNLTSCIEKARQIIWSRILIGSTIAAADTDYNGRIREMLQNIWTEVLASTAVTGHQPEQCEFHIKILIYC